MSNQTPAPKPQRAGQDARVQLNFMSTWVMITKISILRLMIPFEEWTWHQKLFGLLEVCPGSTLMIQTPLTFVHLH